MSIRSLRTLCAAAAALLTVGVCVQAAEDGAPFRLTGPHIAKLDWNTRALVAADLDGDKRIDLAVLNNDRARIELLFQRNESRKGSDEKRRISRDRWEPELEDALFQKVSVPTGIQMFDLAVGDFNGDGRADLAYTGKPDALTVRFQSEDERFEQDRIFDLADPCSWTDTLHAADLNGDGRTDLLALTEKSLAVFEQNDSGSLIGPKLYALSDPNCVGLRLLDLNNDGRLDVSYLAPQQSNPLRVRFAGEAGTLGAERSFDIQAPRTGLSPLNLQNPSGVALAYVQRQSGMIEVLKPTTGKTGDAVSVKDLRPLVYSTRAEAKVAASYAFGDFDGDGRLDLAAGDAEGAEVLLYFQKEKGVLSEGLKFPSYSDIRSVAAADLNGDGKSELIVVSPREQQLGVSRYEESGRMSYPEAITVSGKPLAVAATDLNGDKKIELLVVTETEKKRVLQVLRNDGSSALWTATSLELKDLRQDPSDLRLLDANQDGRMDVAIFAPGQPMRLLVQDEQGNFAATSDGKEAKDSFIDKLTPSGLTTGDMDGDGKAELLLAGEGYARSARLNAQGRLEVIDQYNARRTDSPVAAAVKADLDGDGTGELLLIDAKAGAIQLLKRDEAGVFRFSEEARIGTIDLVEARVLDLDGDKHDDLMLLGKDRFWWLPVRSGGFTLESLMTYETDLRDVTYNEVAVGDLNGDGTDDLLAADTVASHVVELMRVGEGAKLTSATHFTAYEVDPFYSGRGTQGAEPRQVLIDDVTADGKDDLVFLIHDRVLVYPQK